MNFTPPISIGKTSETQVSAVKASHCSHAFSRASHFALILIPSALAVGHILCSDPFTSIYFSAPIYFAFLCGLGGAIGTLKGMDALYDFEERNKF